MSLKGNSKDLAIFPFVVRAVSYGLTSSGGTAHGRMKMIRSHVTVDSIRSVPVRASFGISRLPCLLYSTEKQVSGLPLLLALQTADQATLPEPPPFVFSLYSLTSFSKLSVTTTQRIYLVELTASSKARCNILPTLNN